MVYNCEFFTLGQLLYLIVSIPDLCTLTYFIFMHANNKRADQTVPLRSLIGVFVIHSVECIIAKLLHVDFNILASRLH